MDAAGDQSEPRSQKRNRPGVPLGLGLIAIHLLLMVKIASLGPRRSIAAGDPMGLWMGLASCFWAATLAAAARVPDESFLFRFLDNGRNSRPVVTIFLLGGIALLAIWAGVL